MEVERRAVGLDVLKGLAGLFIVTSHLTPILGGKTALAEALFQPAFGVGADLFFVVAGFLSVRSLDRLAAINGDKVRAALAFYTGRFWRLAPLAWAVATVSALTVWLSGGGASPADVGAAFAFTSDFHWAGCFAGGAGCGDPRVLAHFWWVALLAQFTLAAPVLSWVSARRLLAFVLVALMLGAFMTRPWGGALWTFRLDALLVGALLAVELRDGARVAWAQAWGPLGAFESGWWLLVAAFMARLMIGGASGVALVLVAAICGMMVARTVVCEPARGALLRTGLAWVGRRSYALYLVHPLILDVVRWSVMPSLGFEAAAAIAITATLGCADWLTRLSIEWLPRRARFESILKLE